MKFSKGRMLLAKDGTHGITLIALVITIIVLLILAGISIATLSGDNGVLTKAVEAKKQTKIAEDTENLQLLYVQKAGETKYGDPSIDEYLDYVEEKGYPTKVDNGVSYVEADGSIYEVSIEDGELKVDYVEEGTITDPRIQRIEIVEKTMNSIKISVIASRLDGGTFYYYIGTSEDQLEEQGSGKETEFTFENLSPGQTYYIKVKGVTTDGRETEKNITAQIDSIPDAEGNITYDIRWNNGTATVTFRSTSGYTIETSRDGLTYTKSSVVSGVENGGIVRARLTNGNFAGKEITVTVIDSEKPKLTLKTGKVTSKSIELIATATDNESGVTGQSYNYYIGKGGESSTLSGNNTTGKYTFENLDQNTTYEIKVEIEDRAGNKATQTMEAKTELIPSASSAIRRNVVWNADGTAQVTLSTDTSYNILYNIDGGQWESYSNALSVTNGQTIYMCLTDGRNRGEEYGLQVIDRDGPEITVTRGKITTNSITVNVEAEDKGSGLPQGNTYKYYIKSSNESDYRLIKEGESNTTFTFTGLTAQTTYNIRVTTTDLVGNEGKGEIDATTNEFTYVTGNIEFSEIRWENKLANVTLTNNTANAMEYKIIPKGTEVDLGGTWQTASNKTQTVGNLKAGDIILARLNDGVNTTGYATLTIQDTINPSIEVKISNEQWTNTSVTITINATDNESGLQEQAYSFDGGTNWQAENTKTYEQNTAGIVIKVRDEAGNVTTYNTINITNIDKDGPTMNVETDTTSNSLTVNITSVTDAGIGLEDTPTFVYYIATSSEALETTIGATSTEKTKQYTDLTQNTTYYLKVEVQDKLGNVTTVYKTVSTGSLDASSGDVNITDPEWTNGKASVRITNQSEYDLQYQIVENGESFNENGNWTNETNKEMNIGELKHGDVIYVRLTDGSNVSGTIIKEIKDVVNPTITSVTGNREEWTNTPITLTINATDNESGLQEQAYSFDGGKTWQKENTKIYEQNTAGIVIQVRDIAGNITTYDTIDITKIDKTGPSITIEEQETTTNQSTINVKATDSGVGMEETPTYTYYTKQGEAENYTKIEENQNTTYTFKNLKAGTTYTIKVEAKDTLGNIGEKTLEITTRNLLYSVGDITFTDIIWNNGKATVTANNKIEEYDMQYQIGKDGANINLNGVWTTVKEKSIPITNLEDDDIIYARLTDGVNVTSGYATCNISNISKETYTEEELAKETTRADYEILGISVNNNEIRVQIDGKEENGALYNYYYKTVNDDKYTLISTNTNYNEPAVITDIQEGTLYKIKATIIDTDGNVSRSANTATTIALGQATQNTTYNDNRTYIDNSKEVENAEGSKVVAGYTVSVPAGFKVSETEGQNKQEDGVVLKDNNGNEYVWIPVYDAIYDGVTSMPTSTGTATRTYKPMATKQTGKAGYYESLIYTFNGTLSYRNSSNTGIGKTSYREPSLITNNANDGYTWDVTQTVGVNYDAAEDYYKTVLGFESAKAFGEYMSSSYNDMIMSVDSYGGFYIGRYETTAEETGDGVVVGSQANKTVLANKNWYQMLLYQDSEKYTKNPYNTIASARTSMVWGNQWDAMLNYVLKGMDSTKVTGKTGQQKNTPSNSGQDASDVMNNIYDLGSNLYEWTQEANATNYRIYRGGSYDTASSGRAYTRNNVVPIDQGPAFGTRLGLYVKSTNDVTGPVVTINHTTATSNTITVDVTATDKETGVSSYRYSISENGMNWTQVAETTTNTYTYTGLKQNTNYYIRIIAVDGQENVGEAVETQVKTQTLGNISATAITLSQKYGPDGQGIVQLNLEDTYKNSGYHIETQVVKPGGNFTEDQGWTSGDTVYNLSNGDKIYATVYDGKNRSGDYFELVVDGLEEYAYIDEEGNTYTEEEAQKEENKNQTTYDTTMNYTDEEGNTATIPAGFKVGISDSVKSINNGLVIQDNKGNEYVWVPVEEAIETDTTTDSAQKAMARYQAGYSSGSAKEFFEGILYNFTGTASTKRSNKAVLGTNVYREPTLISGGADYTWNIANNSSKGQGYDLLEQYYKNMGFGTTSGVSAFNSYTEFGQYMNEEYSNMLKSVDKHGGFYVGRYEVSTEGNLVTKDAVIQSQIAKNPIANQNWYKEYYYQDSNLNPKNPYYQSSSVTTSMIWGSQWDAMLNWMLDDDKTREFVTSITGNHTETVAQTGSYSTDLSKNIFDLSSNVGEWTQEGQGTTYRMARGGYCVLTTDKYIFNASSRYNTWQPPTMTSVYSNPTSIGTDTSKNYLGSRTAMYIKDTTDTTAPEISINSKTAGTNNIEVNVTAVDKESGINKYIYAISLKNFEDTGFNEETDILQKVETHGNTYIFNELTQNQSYYIRIQAVNGVGGIATAYTGLIKTEVLNVQEGAIIQEKVYGKNGQGTAYYEISGETNFENEGYYIEYQIDKGGTTGYQPSGSWTKGNTVNGLSVGDVVYTRIYDGVNDSGYYMTTNITELETFSEVYKETKIYEDIETNPVEGGESETEVVGRAYIPAGFKVSTSSLTNKIANGLVIEDEAGNQYVWIPVENAIYDGKTTISANYKPMARYQSGYNESTAEQYFEAILYTFSGTSSSNYSLTGYGLGKSSFREPSLVTNSTANYSWVFTAGNNYDATNYNQLSPLGINSATAMGTYLNDKYTEMVESIAKYGGFYVGRYETSSWETDNWEAGGTNKDNTGEIIKSVPNATTMASTNWYKMYLKQDSNYISNPYHTSSSVTSSMIWGAQWDTMLNYILTGSDKEKVTAVTGNHSGTRAKTGQYGSDIMNNIFDLSSNVREWTSEANGATYRVYRGGLYNTDALNASSYRNSVNPTLSYSLIGSRLSLYLK